MKNDVIVVRVLVVAMKKPVGSLVVYLDVSNPKHAVNLNLGIEEVRSRITVV